MADGADRLKARLEAGDSTVRVGCPRLFHPDGIATILAVQSLGHVASPGGLADVALDVRAAVGEDLEDGSGVVRLPRAPSHLERWMPAELVVTAGPSSEAFPGRSHEALLELARRFDATVPKHRDRPIVVASPSVEPEAGEVLLAWTLSRGAVWALEADPDAFVPAVLWCRPTLAVGRADELDLLATTFRSERSLRRWSRLRAIVVAAGETSTVVEAWRELGVVVLPFASRLSEAAERDQGSG